MNDLPKKRTVASALLDLTRQEALSWDVADNAPRELFSSTPPSLYAATYRGMDLYLYEDADGTSQKDETSPQNAPSVPVLKVAAPDTGASWTFPALVPVAELYALVQFRNSVLEDWMDDILEDADAPPEHSDDEDTPSDSSTDPKNPLSDAHFPEVPPLPGASLPESDPGPSESFGDGAPPMPNESEEDGTSVFNTDEIDEQCEDNEDDGDVL